MYLVRREDGTFYQIAYLTQEQLDKLGRDVLRFDANLYTYMQYSPNSRQFHPVDRLPIARERSEREHAQSELDRIAERERLAEAGGSAVDDLGKPRSV